MAPCSLRVLLAIALAFWVSHAAAQQDGNAVKQVLQAYEQAWSRHDAHAVANFYLELAMRVSKNDPIVRATQTDQEAFFAGFLRSMVARGYERADWETLEARLLATEANSSASSQLVERSD